MMEVQMDSYYTPSIEDFRIGFICQVRNNASATELWDNCLTDSYFLPILLKIKIDGNVRVPYLTKEGLENESWKWRYDDFTFGEYYKERDNNVDYHLSYDYQSKSGIIGLYDKSDTITYGDIFIGKIKCINDFRLVCKMLNI